MSKVFLAHYRGVSLAALASSQSRPVLPQDLVHGSSLGQFIHQLVQVTDLLHKLILDLLHPITADHTGNLETFG